MSLANLEREHSKSSVCARRGAPTRNDHSLRAWRNAAAASVGQSLFETAFLSLFGGIVGVFIALLAIEAIKSICPSDLYRLNEVAIDHSALLFVLALTAFISLFSGFLPAWRLSKADVVSVLKYEAVFHSMPQRQRAQSLLVIGQIALACVLLIGAGLLARSFAEAQSAPLGFIPYRVLTAELSLTSAKYISDKVRTRSFWDEVLAKVRQLPGVEAAGMNSDPPLKNGFEIMVPFTIDGQPDPGPGRQPVLDWQMVSPDYFRTLQIPLLHGRDFGTQDRMDSQKVIIVDEALAQSCWPGQDAIGKVIKLPGAEDYAVVGVVPHIRYMSPGDEESGFQAYFPYNQSSRADEVLLLRSKGDPLALTTDLRKVIASIDPNVAIGRTNTYEDVIAGRLVTRRLSLLVVSLFSGAALLLSAIGVYGMLAYSVSQRTRDLGIRIALGARSSDILSLVTRQGLRLVAIGVVIGIVSALLLGHLIENVLYGVSATDPISLTISVLILGLAAFVACLLPAMRATRINPIMALRE